MLTTEKTTTGFHLTDLRGGCSVPHTHKTRPKGLSLRQMFLKPEPIIKWTADKGLIAGKRRGRN